MDSTEFTELVLNVCECGFNPKGVEEIVELIKHYHVDPHYESLIDTIKGHTSYREIITMMDMWEIDGPQHDGEEEPGDLASEMTEDRLIALVDPKPMTKDMHPNRAFFWLLEGNQEIGYSQTVIHTNPAADIAHIKRFLQHGNPRPVIAIPCTHSESVRKWASISAGTPTRQDSTWYFE